MRFKSRRRAREAAMRILYECEVGGSDLTEAIDEAIASADLNQELGDYSKLLVHGVADNQEALDDELNNLLAKYDLMRLAALDRNILRIGAYEIAYVPYVPPKVSINEAIEIAKKYSTAESGKFINGVLGRFMRVGDRDQYTPESEEEETGPEETVAVEIEERVVEEGSKEAKEAARLGTWKLRSDPEEPTE